MNVLVAPWGMAQTGHLDAVLMAIGLLFCKALVVGAAVVVIESSFAKLRLYKIPEFTVASFMLAVLAVVIFLFEPGLREPASQRVRCGVDDHRCDRAALGVRVVACPGRVGAAAALRARIGRRRRLSPSRPRRLGTAAARCTHSGR